MNRPMNKIQLVKALLLYLVIAFVAMAGVIEDTDPVEATALLVLAGVLAIAYRQVEDPAYVDGIINGSIEKVTDSVERYIDKQLEKLNQDHGPP